MIGSDRRVRRMLHLYFFVLISEQDMVGHCWSSNDLWLVLNVREDSDLV